KKMLKIKSNETIQSGINKLVKIGFLEYVRRNEIDRARTFETGQVRHKPNKYRLLIKEPKEGESFVEVTNDKDMIDVTFSLCTKEEVRQYVKRYEFGNRWSR